jgi:hypothetical protein
MLPAHLRHGDLHSISDLTRRRTRTMRPISQPGKLISEIPANPPVHRRPVHSHLGGNLDHISAIQDRTNRVQALLDNRQDNQCQSRPPQPQRPAETSHQSGRNTPLSQITWRRNVARQSPEDTVDTSLRCRINP